MEPTILCASDLQGRHNAGITGEIKRVEQGVGSYKDLSTIIVVPTRGGNSFTPEWIASMISLVKPMNQKIVGPLFFAGMEVGEAYNRAVWMTQGDKRLEGIRYMLTWEDDIIPQPDALLKLYEAQIATGADIVSALYWDKGPGANAKIYGDIADPVPNWRPVPPKESGIVECYGTGMGFTLFDLQQFNRKVPGPNWFNTKAEWKPGEGISYSTQDLDYADKLKKAGGKIVVCCDAKAGHMDAETRTLW